MNSDTILRIHGNDIPAMTRILLEASDLAGLILEKANLLHKKGQLKEGDLHGIQIGIKPNLVTPSPAGFGATTHQEIIEALIRYLQASTFTNITIMEGSWAGDSTEEAFEVLGYLKLADKFDIPLIDTKKDSVVSVKAGGMDLNICRCAMETEFLINVPVLKGHCQTKMTCALKNMKGLIPDTEKKRFHQLGLHRPIACLNAAIHQDYILVDDICGDPDFEEGGTPWEKQLLLAGLDPVLIDSYAAWELGYDVGDIPYVAMAGALGVGKVSERLPQVTDLNMDGTEAQEAEREHVQPMRRDQSLLDVSYAVEDSDTCSACYANLTEALWRLKQEGVTLKLPEKISIGQGMRGKTGRYGIGACTGDFMDSVPGCPPNADAIYETLKRWMKLS